jgi:hypothetical protein
MVGVAKLVDAQGCGPCARNGRAGSSPVPYPKTLKGRSMNNTPWKYSIEYINTLKDGKPFFTGDMLTYVRKRKSVSSSTLFDHRIILEKLGFLKQTHERGVWIKIKSFPYDVGRFKAQQIAWSRFTWQQWFVPPGWPLLKQSKSEVSNGRIKGGTSNS